MTRRGLTLVFGFASLVAGAAEAHAQCLGTPVAWPAVNPIWELCFRRPSQTQYLADGGGLEISDVRYRGTRVLKVAHVPVFNVKYEEPDGCGGFGFCYRDFFDDEVRFACAPESPPGSGICTATQQPVRTVCQSPGADLGSFLGVAVEHLGDRLKLTSQAEAGWYRYVPSWEFFADGTLRAHFVATAVDDACVAYTHQHHAYFRFDVDLEASDGNVLARVLPSGGTESVPTERSFVDTGAARSHWRVSRPGADYYLDVIRNPEDGAAGDPPSVANDFPIADGWALAYHPDELDDGGMDLGCAARLNPFLTGESLNGADLVLWVRASALHVGEPGGEAQDCSMVGPTLRVVEIPPTPPPGSYHTVVPCRMLDTREPSGPFGGPAFTPGLERSFTLAGRCGIPADAKAVSTNLTVVSPTSAGHVTAWPAGSSLPPTSIVNFGAGQTRANNAVIALGPAGDVRVRSVLAAGSVHVVLDVTGFFR